MFEFSSNLLRTQHVLRTYGVSHRYHDKNASGILEGVRHSGNDMKRYTISRSEGEELFNGRCAIFMALVLCQGYGIL